ncbi:MAG TPA: uroporphyrinogen-III C-methyltransferase [Gemmatimonadaceae bacterium]|nr:uroporphyrinogen-III C-methyltransferase [Gemmatimonadaceae bacterium]
MVALVGAGPGDPDLITVRGRDLIEQSDVVVYDALVNPRLYAHKQTTIGVGKRGGDDASASQADINALLIRLAREGQRVVRLKGGDPFVFGRGSEEAQALAAAGIPFEIVPGVTAGVAAPAYAGIPVTHRGLATSVTFVTGSEDPTKPDSQTDWSALARVGGTIVLYMGVRHLRPIAEHLVAGGLSVDTPAAAIQWGTLGAQRTIVATLSTLPSAPDLASPLIVIIGQTVALRETIAWFDRRPLFGRRILVTRASQRAGTLAGRLRDAGADVVELPSTRIAPLDPSALRHAVRNLPMYRHVVFTSQTAVEFFWSALREATLDARGLAGLTVTAIGPATADALMAHGIAPDVMPDRSIAEGVVDALRDRARGTRVLYPAAEGGRDIVPEGLRAAGATVDVIHAYRSEAIKGAETADRLDLVTFTSASTVTGYVEAVGADAARATQAATIGPITSDAARAAGIEIAVESSEASIPALVDAIVKHYAHRHA